MNPWFPGAALAGLVPPPPTPAPGKSPTGPFALGDPERTQGILESASFTNVRRTAHELVPEVPQEALVDEAQLNMMGVTADNMDAARAAIAAHLARFESGPGMAKLPLAFQIYRATASTFPFDVHIKQHHTSSSSNSHWCLDSTNRVASRDSWSFHIN